MLVGMWLGILMTHFQGISSTDPVTAAAAAFEALINSLKVRAAEHKETSLDE
jgi:hypothetical protein